MWTIVEDGRAPVRCVTIEAAQHHVEDRAVEMWDALRDPNDPDPQVYPGLVWSRNATQRPTILLAVINNGPDGREISWEVRSDDR